MSSGPPVGLCKTNPSRDLGPELRPSGISRCLPSPAAAPGTREPPTHTTAHPVQNEPRSYRGPGAPTQLAAAATDEHPK